MTGLRAAALVLAGCGVLAGAAAGGPSETGSPWAAADHLRTEVEGLTLPGWWVELGAITREAVAGEWEGGVQGGFTGSRFPGVVLAWRRTEGNGGAATRDRSLQLVAPWARGRVSGGVRVVERGERRSVSLPLLAAVHTGGPFTAGATVRFRPGGAPGSADAAVFAAAVHGRWMGTLEAGSPAWVRAAVGIGIGDDLLWSVSVTDLDPTYGLHVRLGSVEIRTETTAHRALGAVTRVRLLWKEAGS